MPDTVEVGRSLLGDRYELGARLGAGGMGVVYHARDTVLDRPVAVKVFREGASAVARTSSETRLLASLNHPALVSIFDAHVGTDEPLYLVMEYVDGPTLQARLERGPLSPKSVARIGRDLAEALHVVHEARIVHRDIKPANVLLRASSVPDEEFHAKLADFGIAYLVDSTRLTTPGTVIGSVAYLSPEQVTGSPPLPASDIYSLGLVLLEALTGQRAFPQATMHEAALARLSQDPVIATTVGQGWGALLTAMTARDPSDRPSALDVMVAINALNSSWSSVDETDAAEVTVADGAKAWNRTDESPTLVVPAGLDEESTPLPTRTTAHIDIDPAPADAVAPPRRAHRAKWIALAGVLAVIVVIIAVGTAVLSGQGQEAEPQPSLPALEEPLTTHFEELLESVSP